MNGFNPHTSDYPRVNALVLPFLDHEFQVVSRIPPLHVLDYSRFALIAFPRVVVSPAFFLESPTSRDSILSSADFFGTEHVRLSMRESSLDAYLAKKQTSYLSWQNEFTGYFAGAEDLIAKLRLPIRPRTSKIAESIEILWAECAQSDRLGSFRHMVNVFPESSIQNSVFEALVELPNSLRGLPFIWQNVCSILDRTERRWRNSGSFPSLLRAFLLRCYFESLCEPCDAIVAFSDFHISIADKMISRPTIPLAPLREFLTAVNLIKPLRKMNAEQILPLISHSACHDFRCRYFEVLQMFRDRSAGELLLAPDQVREWPYNRVVQWFNAVRDWLCRAFGMAGRDAGKRRSHWTLAALLDDGASKGFVKFFEATAKTYLSEMNTLRAQSEMELRSNRTVVQIVNVNANIHHGDGDLNVAPHAGVVGRNASGNVVNQAFDQRAINLPELATELSQLRAVMKQYALHPEHDAAVGQVALAEIEAKAGNVSKALEHLKSAGRWAFDQAAKIGVATASAAIKHALGI